MTRPGRRQVDMTSREIAENALEQARAYQRDKGDSAAVRRVIAQLEAYLADPEASPLHSATRPRKDTPR